MDFPNLEPGTFFDISPAVSQESAVFPMDQPFERKVSMDYDKGDSLYLSSINTTLHVGAHADAPLHYGKNGVPIDQRSLHYYWGPCEVIEVDLERGERTRPADLKGKSDFAERVLFKTSSFLDGNQWRDDFNSLSPELISYLNGQGVKLVGIDTPSIDPSESKALESHSEILKRDMAILEGLDLSEVPAGHYQLVALPLKLMGAEASPVRAILLKG